MNLTTVLSYILALIVCAAAIPKTKLLLLGLDGLRHDFHKLTQNAPNLFKLCQNGVRAERMTPVFPSDSWPNYVSLMTGLYAESHGVIQNGFTDNDLKDKFHYRFAHTDNEKWYTEEPLWLTNEKNGGVSAVYWPGGTAHRHKPRYVFDTIKNYPSEFHKAVAEGKRWLEPVLRDDEVNFLSLWIDYPDLAGHWYGPDSSQYARAIEEVDEKIIGLLLRYNFQEWNIIIVSDHGFMDGSRMAVRYLDDYLDPKKFYTDNDVGMSTIWTLDGATVDEIMANLTVLYVSGGYQIFRKKDIPERLHFKNHKRIPDVLVLPRYGYQILRDRDTGWRGGKHGFDNAFEEMGAVFIGFGPAFKKGVVTPPIDIVDVYPLMAHLLSLKGYPNNGSLSVFKNVLTERYRSEAGQVHKRAGSVMFSNYRWACKQGVINFSQKAGDNEMTTVSIDVYIGTHNKRYIVEIREPGDMVSKGCSHVGGRIKTLSFPTLYRQQTSLASNRYGRLKVHMVQVRGISLGGPNSIIGKAVVILEDAQIPTLNSFKTCGVIGEM